MTDLVKVHDADGVRTITLDSPANRNALSTEVRAGLLQALDNAASSPDCRVVVIGHTGPTFCSGMDLRENVGAAGGPAVRELPVLLQRITSLPQPVIAAVGGSARAGGIGLFAAADLVVATASATFAFSEVRIGLVPAVISVPVLRRMSATVARELLLTGEVFGAPTALATGLVNTVVDAGQLAAAVARYTDSLLKCAPTALAATKQMLRATHEDSDARYAELLAISARQFAGPDGQEGSQAFLEKRAPRWAR